MESDSKLRMRNPLFFFQSPCVVSSSEENKFSSPVLSQVVCDSNQHFECDKNPKGEQSFTEDELGSKNKLNRNTCQMKDVCWSENPSQPVPGCRPKPVPGTLMVSSSYIGERIINGQDANIEDHPWAAYLYVTSDNHYWSCGASIIGKHLILTARHCVRDLMLKSWQIMVGEANYYKLPPVLDPTDYNFILHPNEYVDITLIKLRKPLVFSSRIAPISLPESVDQKPEAGEYATAVGWGIKWQDEETIAEFGAPQPSEQLQAVDIQVVDRNKCGILNSPNSNFDPKKKPFIFCAGGPTGPEGHKVDKDACQGDSGGSLVCTDENKKYVCGVVSAGPRPPDCAKAAGGYVIVSHPQILPWLKNELRQQATWTGGIGGWPSGNNHSAAEGVGVTGNQRQGSKKNIATYMAIDKTVFYLSILLAIEVYIML